MILLEECRRKRYISMDEESANEQQAKENRTNYQPYWIKLNCTQFGKDGCVSYIHF